jgi:hypothetical protein
VDPDQQLAGRCDLVLDNGCLHGLTEREQPGWAATVRHVVAPNATVLVRAAPPRRGPGVGPAGIGESTMDILLGPGWSRSTPPSAHWHQYVARS